MVIPGGWPERTNATATNNETADVRAAQTSAHWRVLRSQPANRPGVAANASESPVSSAAAGGMARWGGEGAGAEAGGATGEAEGEVVDVEAEASQDEQERARDELLRALDDALFTGEVLFSRVAGAAAYHAAEGLHDYPDLDKPWRGLGCFDDERREADRRAEEIEARLLKSLADALERKQQPAKKG